MKNVYPTAPGRFICFLLFSLLSCIAGAQNPVTRVFEDWNDTSGTQNSFQRTVVRSRALGTNTYYYTCGATVNGNGNYDIFVQKRLSTGAVQWTKTYDGVGHGNDVATDVQVDGVGNVYICGTTYKNTTDSNNAIVIKYNAAGTQKWVYTYNGPGSRNDGFAAMYIATANAIAIVGSAWGGSTTKYDFLQVRVDSSGNQVWATTWDYLNLNDGATNFYPSGGKFYVAGGVQSASTTYKYAVINVAANNGSVGTTVVTGGTGFGIDKLTDIQIDKTGKVYVTGGVFNGGSGYDFKTIKFDTALSVMWSATYNSSGSQDDVASGLYLDTAGNVIVTGSSSTASNGLNYTTIKYSSAGTQRWVASFDGAANADDSATAIVVNDTNQIYVTGYSYNGATNDYWTVKYNGAGTKVWDIGFNSLLNGDDRATAIALDTLGAVIVTGPTRLDDTIYDYSTVKYVEKSTTYPKDTISATSSSFVFAENRGQLLNTSAAAIPQIRYYTIHGSPNVYFSDTAFSYVFAKLDTSASHNDTLARVDMKFKSANDGVKVRAMDVRDDYENFFLGHIPEGRSRVQNYDRLVYFNVWNNIDVISGSNLRGLKYYFICKPGSSPSGIDLLYNGADSIKVGGSGQLLIYTKLGVITQPKAAAWELDGSGNFYALGWQPSYNKVASNDIMFSGFGSWNTAHTLVIAVDWGDVQPQFSTGNQNWGTFLGGGNADIINDLKVANNAKIVTCGSTLSSSFPTTISPTAGHYGGQDAFIFAFNADQSPYWYTYYGGNNLYNSSSTNSTDFATALDIDLNNNIFITGATQSSDLPTYTLTGADNQLSHSGCASGSCFDGFIFEVDNTGQFPIWGRYYGGLNEDQFYDISISPVAPHDLYLVGYSNSGFPAYNAPGLTSGTGCIVQFNSAGALLTSGSFGGSGSTIIRSITVDISNNPIIVGYTTSSTDFPIISPASPTGNSTYGGGLYDAFITKLNYTAINTITPLSWSTYFGGNAGDLATSVVTTPPGNAVNYFVVGSSSSSSPGTIPLWDPMTGNYYFGANNGSDDAFIAQLNSSGSLLWSTYFGGTGNDEGLDITLDGSRNIYITGYSQNSSNFPFCSPAGAFNVTSLSGTYDAFIASFQNSTRAPLWCTFFGGNDQDVSQAIACYNSTELYIGGSTNCSSTFPFDPGNGTPYYDNIVNGSKGFIAGFGLAGIVGLEEANTSESFFLYPNPATTQLSVSGLPKGSQKIEIINSIGEIVISQTILSEAICSVDVSSLAPGLYLVRIENENFYSAKPIIINKE